MLNPFYKEGHSLLVLELRLVLEEEVQLLEELPSTLRLQLAVALNQGYLLRLPVFQMADSRSVALVTMSRIKDPMDFPESFVPLAVLIAEGVAAAGIAPAA